MQIGIGLDQSLGLSYDEQATVSAEAAKAGYESIWTPEKEKPETAAKLWTPGSSKEPV